MQLLVQLQLQVFPHNQADKHQFFSGVASHPKWCSQKSERRQMIPRKPSGERSTVLLGQGQAMQRLWAWCTLQTQNTSDDCHRMALHTAMAQRQSQTQISLKQIIYAWTVLQRGHEGTYKPPVQMERGQSSAGCSFLGGKNPNKKPLLHKPASTWNYSFVVSTISDRFLLQWNIIFNVLLLLKRSGLRSEQERPETAFEKLSIQYLSHWNLRECREVRRRNLLILSHLTQVPTT